MLFRSDKEFEIILKSMHGDVNYMQGIQGQINSQARSQDKIDQLAIFLDEIDRRRNLNWRQTFPWLTKEVSHVV